jgi:hypothetical protein
MIFVHGYSGSGGQFESQALRFESNFYPADYIFVLEYDSSASPGNFPAVWARLDELVAAIQEETGAAQVDILGHSLGTAVMQGWLALPGRAANVAHYVNIDGQPAGAPPGGVPTLALWAERGLCPGCSISGATNVTIPNQTHVQVATSAESFVEMYKFFTGRPPLTKYILPELFGRIELAGRAVLFPQNVGVPNRTLEIWEVNGKTGARIGNHPKAVYPLSGDGSWGPFKAKAGAHYEFALVREGIFTHHFYYEPFIRSDYLIRLNTEEPGTGIGAYMDYSDHTTNVIAIRYKELWGDQGAENDTLEVNGTNVVRPLTHPIAHMVNATFAFDDGPTPGNNVPDGVSHVGVPLFPFYLLPFMAGVDLSIPGVSPPDGTIPVVLTPRDGGGKTQVINVPNWASLNDRVTVQLHDYLQTWPW